MIKKIKKLTKLLVNGKYRKGLFNGTAAGIEHEDVLKNIECKTIVDIGANKGQFALAARKYFPNAKIYSFEPLLHPAEIFEKVFESDSNVKLFRYAVSDTSGETEIHLSRREDSSSLLPIAEKQNEMFPGTFEIGVEKITAKKLSEVLAPQDIIPPALMKIDVQGFELNVLKGSEELLQGFKYIYSECSYIELYKGQALYSEINAFLESRGFKKVREYHTSYDSGGNPIQSDFLFERM